MAEAILCGDGLARFVDQSGEQIPGGLDVFGVNEFKNSASDEFAAGVTQIAQGRGFRVVKDGSIWIDEGNAIRTFLNQRPEAALALAQRFFLTFEILRQKGQFVRVSLGPAPAQP